MKTGLYGAGAFVAGIGYGLMKDGNDSGVIYLIFGLLGVLAAMFMPDRRY